MHLQIQRHRASFASQTESPDKATGLHGAPGASMFAAPFLHRWHDLASLAEEISSGLLAVSPVRQPVFTVGAVVHEASAVLVPHSKTRSLWTTSSRCFCLPTCNTKPSSLPTWQLQHSLPAQHGSVRGGYHPLLQFAYPARQSKGLES